MPSEAESESTQVALAPQWIQAPSEAKRESTQLTEAPWYLYVCARACEIYIMQTKFEKSGKIWQTFSTLKLKFVSLADSVKCLMNHLKKSRENYGSFTEWPDIIVPSETGVGWDSSLKLLDTCTRVCMRNITTQQIFSEAESGSTRVAVAPQWSQIPSEAKWVDTAHRNSIPICTCTCLWDI